MRIERLRMAAVTECQQTACAQYSNHRAERADRLVDALQDIAKNAKFDVPERRVKVGRTTREQVVVGTDHIHCQPFVIPGGSTGRPRESMLNPKFDRKFPVNLRPASGSGQRWPLSRSMPVRIRKVSPTSPSALKTRVSSTSGS